MSEPKGHNTIVTASAGTGKTYRLVSEFVSALLGSEYAAPVEPEAILALTFTEKAAAEMKTRIAARLAEIELPKKVDRQKLLRDFRRATVTTYHSFCAKILRDYASQVGVDEQFALLDPFEESELSTKVARAVVLRHLDSGDPALMSLVARLQLEGQGEARGVVGYLIRVREQLIESGSSPETMPPNRVPPPQDLLASGLLLEALRGVAESLAAYDGVAETLSEGAKTKVAGAREAFGRLYALLQKSCGEVAISSAFSELKEQISGRFGKDDLRKNLVADISKLGSLLCASFVAPECSAFRVLLSDFWAELEASKKQSLSLGFGDLLVLVRRLLFEDLAVRRELKARFTRVLVDEYQDTSPCQEDIVALLCESGDNECPLASHESALDVLKLSPGKLFVVGDPKQSIYGFRGSDVALFEKMSAQIVKQDGQRESLNVSRRSAPLVVAVVNAVVPCDQSEQLVAMREGAECAGALLQHPCEALAIAAEVQGLLSARSSVAKTHSFEPKDVAILVRRAKKAGPILQALLQAGIPARIFGGEGFFDRQEVVELVAALTLAIRPDDSLALLTVMRSPLLSFPDSCWARLFEALQTSQSRLTLPSLFSVFGQIDCDDAFNIRFKNFHALIEKIREHSGVISAIEALQLLFEDGVYLSLIAAQSDASLCMANIHKLKALLLQSEGDFTTQVTRLSRKVQMAPKEAMGEEEQEANVVRIMTIHQSKGLEFPVVFVADTKAGIPSDSSDVLFDKELGLALNHRGRPIAVCAPESKEMVARFATPIQAVRARMRQKNEAELSRLLYVALTRAREFVYFVDEIDDASTKLANKNTLKALFNQGYEANKDAMSTFMPIVTVAPDCESVIASVAKQSSLLVPAVDGLPSVARNDEKSNSLCARPLLFASDLLSLPAKSGPLRGDRLTFQFDAGVESSASERGRLAHDLIRMATVQLSPQEFEDKGAAREVLDASVRFLGAFGPFCSEIVDSCLATLDAVIFPLCKSGFEFRFEVPLRYELPEFVIKGFADAVATREDISCVIDFKSSEQAARSQKTRLQLLAYCAALKNAGSTRVFFASCVIGKGTALDFEAFDDSAQKMLFTHINALSG